MSEFSTITIQIGNTDNKLSQQRWSDFCGELQHLVADYEVHFSAGSPSDSAWQNYCVVLEVGTEYRLRNIAILEGRLKQLAFDFDQDSIAMTVGINSMVKSKNIEIGSELENVDFSFTTGGVTIIQTKENNDT